jgi:colanic acid biosynthesis glycosyl transferase WcaI
MRITIVNQFYKPDLAPTAHLAATLAEHRAAMGDQVTIIAGKGAYTAKPIASTSARTAENPRILRVWTPGLGKSTNLKRLVDYAAFYAFALFKLVTMPRQDVIITLTTPPLIAWAATLHKALRRRTRLILWNMDCYPDVVERAGIIPKGGFLARCIRARNRAIFRRLDHLVCLDKAMADLLCSQYASAKPHLPVSIIPNYEDAGFFPRNAEYPPWEGISRLNLHGRFIVLYLGNMGYGHQFDTVLDAAEQLQPLPVTFLFIGGGRNFQSIADEAQRRNLSNIVMHPYIPKEQSGTVMAAAHCALVTLRDDALGVMSPSKIHSNLALGLPLAYIGPATSNVDEAIQHHGCGVSLRHGDVAGLVSFITRMMEDPDQHAELRCRARAAFDSAYCDTATMPQFGAVIQHAISGVSPMPGIPAGAARDYGPSSRSHA